MPTLRPYQKADVNKLKNFKCVGILNQQRTGKTPTSLILCSELNLDKILIVCPGSMLYKWKTEFETWLQRPCIVLDGTPTIRAKKLKEWKTGGLCITYDTLKLVNRLDKETNKIKKTGELVNIIKAKPDAIIVDEFHRARNPKTLLAKALFKLTSHIEYRIALTGTPAYGKDLDIFSLIKFLYPNNIGTFTDFKEKHCDFAPIYTPRGIVYKPYRIKPESERRLQNFLNKFTVQRKQTDPEVMPWLPKKPIPQLIKLPLSKEQNEMMANMQKYFETDGILVQGVLDRVVRYRQILIDPRLLVPTKKHSPKTEWILNYFKDYKETPTIFFTWFTSYLHLLKEDLDKSNIKYAIIEGSTPKIVREQYVQQFQKGEIDHLFINIQTGKEGLTLDRAEHLVFIDQLQPAGDIDQAVERITATTEERAQIPKHVFKLIMDNSLEEKIEEAIQLGLNSTDAYNNYMQYLNRYNQD